MNKETKSDIIAFAILGIVLFFVAIVGAMVIVGATEKPPQPIPINCDKFPNGTIVSSQMKDGKLVYVKYSNGAECSNEVWMITEANEIG